MSLREWQIALRREYGVERNFAFENLGTEPFFSEFAVTNPESGGTYRVAIRGEELGFNFCSCPDFAVNTLGTCKHIEWLLAKLRRKRGGKRAFQEGFRPPYSEVFLQYGARRVVRFRRGTEFPPKLNSLADQFFDAEGFFREAAMGKFERFVQSATKDRHDIRIYDDALDFVAGLRDDENRRAKIDAKFQTNGKNRGFKKLLKVNLYPYQQQGALFAAKAGRCLLADDMGLGKTIQVIDLLLTLRREDGGRDDVRPTLLIVPASLIGNWKSEFERFAPALRVFYAHGSEVDAEQLRRVAESPESGLSECDVVLTTYGLARRMEWLAKVRWRLVVLD
ncbi:MAG: SWIM zinc finger family protein, partial [Candidatus Omnitrophica bacterium]|nr:SWIM zinc finger family protein [Candidatus Omnitrophota bacterium]